MEIFRAKYERVSLSLVDCFEIFFVIYTIRKMQKYVDMIFLFFFKVLLSMFAHLNV